MNCEVAQNLLQQDLDGTLIESPEWLAHLRHCGDCRTLASAGRRLQDGLRLLTAPVPAADLAERIVERVRLDRRRARRRIRRRWAVSLALAAGLLLVLALRPDWRGQSPRREGNISEPMAKSAPAPQKEATPTLRESAVELGEVFAALSNQTAEETVGQTRRWVSNVYSPTLPKIDLTAMEPPARSFREAGEGVSEGLEPVTTSARRAVGLFLRELPPMEKD